MKYTAEYVVRSVILCAAAIVISANVSAAQLEGTVTSVEGAPIPVAMISLFRDDDLYLETVYADNDGRYAMHTSLSGDLTMRVRSPGYADMSTTTTISADEVNRKDVRLDPLTTDQQISDSLTASSHFTRVRLPDDGAQKLFQNDCLSCHQLGNAFTRRPRSKDEWSAVVDRMLGFWNLKPGENPKLIAVYADLLASAFDGALVVKQERHDYDPDHERVMVKEWKYPAAVIAHDATVNSRDGLFYTFDQGNDNVYITDPKTNVTETITLPANGMPIGGRLGGMIGNSSAAITARHGPHSLQEGPDGKFYLTLSFANQIGVFDPKTRDLAGYDVEGGAVYPHTLRFDHSGRVWFSILNSNQIGRFDPATKEMKVINLPTKTNRKEFNGLMPYGIDVNPLDGSIWYSVLGAQKIGRIDPDSLAIQEFDTPFIGPRRLRFGADGILWIPAFGEGKIARLNTATMEYKIYPIPRLTPDGVEVPYALAVHPDTGDVWITANMSDRMFRFIPSEERFIAYPLPTRGTYQRDIFFTPDGWVCGPSSPLPAGPTVEGGMQGLICIITDSTPKTGA